MGKLKPNGTWRPFAPSKHEALSTLQIKMYKLPTSKETNQKIKNDN
jgi:hypothetical protein